MTPTNPGSNFSTPFPVLSTLFFTLPEPRTIFNRHSNSPRTKQSWDTQKDGKGDSDSGMPPPTPTRHKPSLPVFFNVERREQLKGKVFLTFSASSPHTHTPAVLGSSAGCFVRGENERKDTPTSDWPT